jgi:hypothetical protein
VANCTTLGVQSAQLVYHDKLAVVVVYSCCALSPADVAQVPSQKQNYSTIAYILGRKVDVRCVLSYKYMYLVCPTHLPWCVLVGCATHLVYRLAPKSHVSSPKVHGYYSTFIRPSPHTIQQKKKEHSIGAYISISTL